VSLSYVVILHPILFNVNIGRYFYIEIFYVFSALSACIYAYKKAESIDKQARELCRSGITKVAIGRKISYNMPVAGCIELSSFALTLRKEAAGMTLLWIIRILLLLLVLYLFLIAPNLLHRKLCAKQLTDHAYAHRGLHDNARGVPENSMAAFQKAVQAGYGIELDVRETRDHVLVVHHDETLERSCGDSRRVCDVPLAELQQLSLFKTSEHIPTFDEVLSLVNGQVPLIVELKTDFYNHSLPQTVYQCLSQYNGAYCIESFDPFAVRWYRKNARSVVRGQLAFMPPLKQKPFKEKLRRIALGYLLIDFLGRPDFIAYGYKTDANISFRIVASVFRPLLAAWTVCDQETYHELQQYYDIQIFERFRAQ
jgi:hypothetical protein